MNLFIFTNKNRGLDPRRIHNFCMQTNAASLFKTAAMPVKFSETHLHNNYILHEIFALSNYAK